MEPDELGIVPSDKIKNVFAKLIERKFRDVKLIDTLTDDRIRSAMLSGIGLDAVMRMNPVTARYLANVNTDDMHIIAMAFSMHEIYYNKEMSLRKKVADLIYRAYIWHYEFILKSQHEEYYAKIIKRKDLKDSTTIGDIKREAWVMAAKDCKQFISLMENTYNQLDRELPDNASLYNLLRICGKNIIKEIDW